VKVEGMDSGVCRNSFSPLRTLGDCQTLPHPPYPPFSKKYKYPFFPERMKNDR
jgi:hypothetical protein